MLKKNKNLLSVILILILSYFAVRPLFIGGFFPMHDDTQPARVFALATELKSGIFPVRLVGTLGYGYGYPLFNFYAPLPYYFGALYYLAGLDLIIATKMMFLTGVIFAGVFMFLLASELAGPAIGVLVSLFYVYAPYHAVNIFVRGAVGEYYAFAFLPLLVLGIYRLFLGKSNFLLPATLGLSAILLSHNISGMVILYLLGILGVILMLMSFSRDKSKKALSGFMVMAALSIGLSSFFIFPAFFEKNATRVLALSTGNSRFENHFVSLTQLWDSPWGFGGSTSGTRDGLSFKIGKIHLISGLGACAYFLFLAKKKKVSRNYVLLILGFASIFALSVLMMTSVSRPLYESLPLLDFVQYPWRFLNLSVFSLVLMLVSIRFIKNLYFRHFLIASLSLVVIIINAKYFDVRYIYALDEKSYLKSESFKFTSSKISDEYLPGEIETPDSVREIKNLETEAVGLTGVVEINETVHKVMNLNVFEKTEFVSNVAVFPGWRVTVDGKAVPINNNRGFIAFDVNPGMQIIEMKFGDTFVRKASNAISFLSAILILYLTIPKNNVWLKRHHSK